MADTLLLYKNLLLTLYVTVLIYIYDTCRLLGFL